jgi:hypothetical protein
MRGSMKDCAVDEVVCARRSVDYAPYAQRTKHESPLCTRPPPFAPLPCPLHHLVILLTPVRSIAKSPERARLPRAQTKREHASILP